MSDKRIFVNFTNHPSDEWDDAQLGATEAYGKIVDVPFPVVGENASEEEILNLCNHHLSMIKALGRPEDLTVHIMGEQSFCYAMISKLQTEGIRCVASCTLRDVHVNDAGQKVSAFHFTRFRDYVPPKRLCLRRRWKKQVERMATRLSSISLKKNRNFFSQTALWIILLFELLLICDLQLSWFSPCILFVVAVVLLLVLYGVGICNGHHFSIRSTIVTKLLANAVTPTALGAFYLLVFVVHIGWLTNAALGWYTAVDDEFSRVLYSTAACIGGMIALIIFFPKGGEQKASRPQKVFISGISAISTVPDVIAKMSYDTLNLLPLVRILQLVQGDDQPPLFVILQTDAFKNSSAQDVAFNRALELMESTADMGKCGSVEDKLRLLIRELAKKEFPDKVDMVDAMTIEFTEPCNYSQNFEKAYSILEQRAKELDDKDHQLYFNLTPGTGIIGSLMTLMSIDGDRLLYYYAQEKMANAATASAEEKRAFREKLLLPVDKKQIPLQALLSQALEKLS